MAEDVPLKPALVLVRVYVPVSPETSSVPCDAVMPMPTLVAWTLPARKVSVCVALPMRMMPDSPATPEFPISMLLLPEVSAFPELEPRAMFPDPVLL